MSKRSCVDCRWADFVEGMCVFPISKAVYVVLFRSPRIDKAHPFTDCPTYERKETDANG